MATAALRHLLAAWQKTPANAIAEAIEVVGARAASGLQPPTGKTVAARNAAWDALAAEGDPVIRGTLVASLAEINNFPGLSERIELLLKHPPDPRVAQRIADLVETPVFSPTIPRHSGNWSRLWAVLAKLGDPRILARAAGFSQRWATVASENQRAELEKGLGRAMPALTAAYGKGVPALSAADSALLRAMVERAKVPAPAVVEGKRSEEELLAAIHASPSDDAPRAVYAELLQERGDPRGEFIALQLAAKRTKEGRAREKELLAEYAARWVEPLGAKKASAKFERGFVVACDVEEKSALATNPAWSTVRVISRANTQAILDLTKRATPPPLEELVWDGPYTPTPKEQGDGDEVLAIAAWQKLSLPELRRLSIGQAQWGDKEVTAAKLDWLWRSPALAKLEELTLHAPPSSAAAIVASVAATSIRRLELCCAGHLGGVGWHLLFERDGAGPLSQLAILVDPRPLSFFTRDRWGEEIIAAVPALPPLTSARVVVAKRTAAEFEGRVRKRLAAAFTKRGDVELVIEAPR